ncbi:MAG: excinuclease ABC subunit UvrA, partial [Clostridia bacterium]|nr:excinuclease ABC subunit UvrA [Clostridia bacterium]
MGENIVIKGAREHNLKNIDITLPRDKFIVITGLSGSGKSSLAFDTIYAEGHRRYVESLSSYARQFLGQMEKPDVDSIEGLSPSISIDQKTTNRNPHSTVGTVTEIYDYLRLLYARVGVPHCPVCGKEIKQQTVDQIIDKVMELSEGTKFMVMAPIIREKKGEHQKVFKDALKSGYARVRVDGIIYDLTEEIKLEKNNKHSIEIIVDRLVMKEDMRQRLADSVETALSIANGLVIISVVDGEDMIFSQNYACADHGISVEELSPRMFSFNNPFGACKSCSGLGVVKKIDIDKIVPNKDLTIREGAIRASGWYYMDEGSFAYSYLTALADKYKFSLDVPVNKLSKKALDIIFYGSKGEKLDITLKTDSRSTKISSEFEGIINNLERRYLETKSEFMRHELDSYMSDSPCKDCGGERLNPIARNVTVADKSITEVTRMSISKCLDFFKNISLSEKDMKIARLILKEIVERLSFLKNVGLEYLTLSREARSLSGGESQRIRLATQIGSHLMGVLYILDEPSIGLHQRDNQKLLDALKSLRDLGNTLIVVEHDEDTMHQCDYIVDIGPGAGVHGGEVVFTGTYDEILKSEKSITGEYLSGRKRIEVPKKRREGNGKFIEVIGAKENNLKNINVKIPLGTFTCVT